VRICLLALICLFSFNSLLTLSRSGVACISSFYKSVLGDGPCTSCGVGREVPSNLRPGNDSSSCACFGAHRTGSNCDCDLGYTLAGSDCVACTLDSYKDTPGNFACTLCPDHALVNGALGPGMNVADCVCPENSELQGNRCLCYPGYEFRNSACRACSSTQWKSTYGDGPCGGA
jgi:hypothetical protein